MCVSFINSAYHTLGPTKDVLRESHSHAHVMHLSFRSQPYACTLYMYLLPGADPGGGS